MKSASTSHPILFVDPDTVEGIGPDTMGLETFMAGGSALTLQFVSVEPPSPA
ncbi:hypothetical protein [Candidatus Methylomirabilis sp.]|uniref:hypothetical protein n=1 Tax=Candidatus Methylomirabilis sp. TaxID=2032687 RepID=UPI003C7204E3